MHIYGTQIDCAPHGEPPLLNVYATLFLLRRIHLFQMNGIGLITRVYTLVSNHLFNDFK